MSFLFASVIAGVSLAAQPQASPPADAKVAATTTKEPIELYVDSERGDDAGDGLSSEHALKSPIGARNRIRAMKAAAGGELGRGVRVLFEPGRYELAEPLVLTPEDSGSLGKPVEYVGRGPVIWSAGVTLGEWKEMQLSGKLVWAAKLPEGFEPLRDGKPAFRSLWVTGERMTWARYPNGVGYAQVDAVPEKPEGDWTKGPTSFAFAEKDAEEWSRVSAGAEVVVFSKWVDSHLRVASVERDKRLARFETPSVIGIEPGALYYAQGAEKLLDAPGEWWCDAEARIVYYMPRPGDDSSRLGVVPKFEQALRIEGKPEAGVFVEHLAFENIGMGYTRWWFPPDFKSGFGSPGAVGFVQAAAGAPAAVRAEGARGIRMTKCVVFATEAYGIELGRGCTGWELQRCELSDLGAGGIKIGETAIREGADVTGKNLVENCVIENGGNIHHQAVGVWIGQSGGNTLRHNRISHLDYTGISIGWTWGYGPSAAGGNLVEFNEVAYLGERPDRGQPPLGDMGGIYTLGSQPGTVIRNNYFHHIAGHTIAWGIYFDEGTTGVVAEYNAVVGTSHGGFHQHYGKDNIVRNNLFLGGKAAAIWRTRKEDHTSFTFTKNLVMGDSAQWFAGDWSGGVTLAGNCYFRPDGKPIVFPGGRDLAAWQAAGFDAGSMIGDPKLQDPDKADFFPGDDSALDAMGIELVSVRRTGPKAEPAQKVDDPAEPGAEAAPIPTRSPTEPPVGPPASGPAPAK